MTTASLKTLAIMWAVIGSLCAVLLTGALLSGCAEAQMPARADVGCAVAPSGSPERAGR